jgi:hypothetical protein
MNSQITPSPKDTLTEKQGIDVTTNWRTYIANIDSNPNYIRAFNIPMSDIQNLADFTQCPNVRAYLAMDDPKDISTLKIILVPVDANNNDVLSIPISNAAVGDDTQSAIYDLTNPCPKICDIASPLFQYP